MKISLTLKVIIGIIICEVVGLLGSLVTTPQINSWYATIVRPDLAPPNWVFGPVWTILFVLMGIALALIWNRKSSKERKTALLIFVGQLALNLLWSVLFFGLQSPLASLIEIVALWCAILASIITFSHISKAAAWLLLPYILWVTFATYLNYSIVLIN